MVIGVRRLMSVCGSGNW